MEDVEKRLRAAVEAEGFDALILFGVDDLTYAGGLLLPFAQYYPDRSAILVKGVEGRDVVICPLDWADTVADQGWRGEVVAYDENAGAPPKGALEALAGAVSQLGLAKGRIGVDMTRTPEVAVERLRRWFPDAGWADCDGVLRGLRMVKTRGEVELLEAAALQSEKGLVAALMHLEGAVDFPGYTVPEFAERVRVHVFEYGGSGVGHLSVARGADTQLLFAPQRGIFQGGELVRIDLTNHYRGYWSNAGRMAITGEATERQAESYESNLALKAAAEGALAPGVRCSEVFEAVRRTAAEMHIPFWEEAGVGHGVGASPWEAPHLCRGEETVLEEGMVIALDVYTYGPRRELIHSKDSYEVVEGGSRLLSWYRRWNRLYELTGFRATH